MPTRENDPTILSIITAVYLGFDDTTELAQEAAFLRELAESYLAFDQALNKASAGQLHCEWLLCVDNTEPQASAWQQGDLAEVKTCAQRILYTGKAHSGAALGRDLCFAEARGAWLLPIDGDDHLALRDASIAKLAQVLRDERYQEYGYIGCSQELYYREDETYRLCKGFQSDVACGAVEDIKLKAKSKDLARAWGDLGAVPFHSGNALWNCAKLFDYAGEAPWDPATTSENTVLLLEYSTQTNGLFAPLLTTKEYRCGHASTTTATSYLAGQDDEQAALAARIGVGYTELPRFDGAAITKVPLEIIEADPAGQAALAKLRNWAATA
ncbi:MAG: hypothetical protein LBL67_00335 [Coriobacteriales bacterium]|nr:hypothetical protein [Coriobacteriales bacterium]